MAVLVGKKAPLFKAKAVINGEEIVADYSLEQFLGKKHVILFFYPKDFTFVCPTELHAFQARLKEFEQRNVAVVAVSTDTEQSHWGWLQLSKDHGGIQGITYPIVADTNKTISHNYDVLAHQHEDRAGSQPARHVQSGPGRRHFGAAADRAPRLDDGGAARRPELRHRRPAAEPGPDRPAAIAVARRHPRPRSAVPFRRLPEERD